jgi:hypothetical protein
MQAHSAVIAGVAIATTGDFRKLKAGRPKSGCLHTSGPK